MARKDILKDMSAYDALCGILLTKPKSKEGCGRFDAGRLYSALKSSEKYNGLVREIDTMLSVLRRGHTIFQYQDELHTEVYYLNDKMCNSITRDLEKRLGIDFLEKFSSITKDVWKRYDSFALKNNGRCGN